MSKLFDGLWQFLFAKAEASGGSEDPASHRKILIDLLSTELDQLRGQLDAADAAKDAAAFRATLVHIKRVCGRIDALRVGRDG